ncbi:MAG: sigma-70 family RNA polymerase sigma factor [Pirellulaceae bacterium]|nr:sigma-70 family RNA polymerase sigma factor [Planctomycetales bacterium]
MSDVENILKAINEGDLRAAEQLLPIVYEDLKRLARQRLSREQSGQSLQATDLVHEAYLRLVGNREVDWNGEGHFFGAAAEAMRRILIDRARRRCTQKHGGDCQRIELSVDLMPDQKDERLVQLDEVLDQLREYDARKADVVNLRFFAGLTNEEAAAALGISPATAQRDWVFARAWLQSKLR